MSSRASRPNLDHLRGASVAGSGLSAQPAPLAAKGKTCFSISRDGCGGPDSGVTSMIFSLAAAFVSAAVLDAWLWLRFGSVLGAGAATMTGSNTRGSGRCPAQPLRLFSNRPDSSSRLHLQGVGVASMSFGRARGSTRFHLHQLSASFAAALFPASSRRMRCKPLDACFSNAARWSAVKPFTHSWL